MRIRKDDTVLVLSGKDKGKRGKVRRVLLDDNQVIVEGVGMIKRHTKAGQGKVKQAGIIEKEAPINVSRVMLVCKRCDKASRVGFHTVEDGKKVRFCRSCKEVIE
jgi:large subunit ribosomal protein L24